MLCGVVMAMGGIFGALCLFGYLVGIVFVVFYIMDVCWFWLYYVNL